MKKTIEWILYALGFIGAIWGARAGYLAALKELSVGKTALKKANDRIQLLEDEVKTLRADRDDLQRRVGRGEIESDAQHKEIVSLSKALTELNSIVSSKIAV